MALPSSAPTRTHQSPFASGMALIWLLALAKFIFHIYYNNRYGYFRDEFDYISCGDHLAWGYVDQPPLIPFLIHICRAVLGDSHRPDLAHRSSCFALFSAPQTLPLSRLELFGLLHRFLRAPRKKLLPCSHLPRVVGGGCGDARFRDRRKEIPLRRGIQAAPRLAETGDRSHSHCQRGPPCAGYRAHAFA